MEEQEVKRIKGFSHGDTKCIVCGKDIHLYWNDGELDEHKCCGYIYRTEHQVTDLIIYKISR